MPKYFFRIDEIGESPNATQNVDLRGNWIPSTEEDDNIRIGGGVSGRTWYCDNQQIYAVGQLPAGCAPYKTYSVYYSAGHGFWVFRGDATDPSDDENWHPLRFEWDEQDGYSSYLTNAAEHNTLRIQRAQQQWPSLLLPDIYHTTQLTPYQQYGGLKGELPIFLALMALSTSREWLPNVLPTIFAGGQFIPHTYGLPRTNQRGVVVAVYTAPHLLQDGSAQNELRDYEEGRLGKYFY
ncbi:hypothetical protein BDV96DRAFT_117764 [Lophiotrema nucula]|uniref:Uncharacterized protein n=1 Tax=Lophiotrema nucula TaxID=690887 RepID=A0A6A5Z5W4_9PLEO|nr:hypothetical protein BDV96DRAFT_117764 [Lophiotrema nucula]